MPGVRGRPGLKGSVGDYGEIGFPGPEGKIFFLSSNLANTNFHCNN